MEILGKKTRTTDVSVTKIIQEIDELTFRCWTHNRRKWYFCQTLISQKNSWHKIAMKSGKIWKEQTQE